MMELSVYLLLFCLSYASPRSFDPVNDYLDVYPDPNDSQILQGRTPLYFSLIQSLGGPLSLYDGSGSIAGVKVALDAINNDITLLPGYTLHYTFSDSKCNVTESFKAFFSQILKEPPKLAVLGGGCSPATEAIAEISYFYNITQTSCVASSTGLRNRVRFPYYFQMLVTEETMAYAYFSIIKEYNLKKVALIIQNENLFTVTIVRLKLLLDSINCTYSSKVFNSDKGIADLGPEPFDGTSRIFLISAYVQHARKLLCEAYYRGIRFPKYLLLTLGWYRRVWWRVQDEGLSCSVADRESVLPASLAFLNFKFISTDDKDRVTSTGITGGEFLEAEKPFLGRPPLNLTFFEYSQYCHDGVWTLAYALNKTINEIAESSLNQALAEAYNVSRPFRLDDFNYSNDLLLKIIFKHIQNTKFDGVTGPVRFNDQGIRILNELIIFQFRNVTSATNGSVYLDWVEIGNVLNGASGLDNLTFKYKLMESITTVWQGLVPYDGIPKINIVSVNIFITVFDTSLAIVGIVFAITCFFFNLIFRNSKLIRLASPKLNYLIVVGAIILYMDIIFASVPSTNVDVVSVFCNLTPWMTAIGYSLCYGTILVKMARVYYIFNNPSTTKKSLKDWMLILAVFVMVAIDLVVLITYTVVLDVLNVDGGLIAKRVLDSGNPSDTDGPQEIITEYYVYICTSTSYDIVVGVLYGYKMVLQVVALGLAFSIRRVKVKGLDDSKYVAATIYVTSLVLAVIIVSTYSLKSYISAVTALFCIGFLGGTTVILILVFVPLMVRLYKDPKGEEIFTKSEFGGSKSNSVKIHTLLNTVSDADMTILKKRVMDLENELEDVKLKNKSLKRKVLPETKILDDLYASNLVQEDPHDSHPTRTIWDEPNDELNGKARSGY